MFGINRMMACIKAFIIIKEECIKADRAKAMADEQQRKCEEAYKHEQYPRSLIHF